MIEVVVKKISLIGFDLPEDFVLPGCVINPGVTIMLLL